MPDPAIGSRSPIWPLPAVTRRRWTFGASRASGERRHAGVDLYAPPGSVVHAPESGTLIASQRFLGPEAVALLMQTDTGPVILFGEVFPQSWERFGLAIGSRVEAGDPVAEVGITPGGSSMLHFEMYREGTRRNARWMTGDPPPPSLLDPTDYLKIAMALDQGDDDVPDDDPDDEHDDEHDDEADEADDTNPDTQLPSDCPAGWHWDPLMQTCVADPTPPIKPPPDPPPDTEACPPGWHWDPLMQTCVADPTPPDDPGGDDGGPCPPGFRRNADGVCVVAWPGGGDDDDPSDPDNVPDVGPPPPMEAPSTMLMLAVLVAAVILGEDR
jgi:hypothetical protein